MGARGTIPNEVMWPPRGVVHAYGKRSLTGKSKSISRKNILYKTVDGEMISTNEMIVELQREKERKRKDEYSLYSLHQPSLVIYTEDYFKHMQTY